MGSGAARPRRVRASPSQARPGSPRAPMATGRGGGDRGDVGVLGQEPPRVAGQWLADQRSQRRPQLGLGPRAGHRAMVASGPMAATVRELRAADVPRLLDLIDGLADYERLPRPTAEARERL